MSKWQYTGDVDLRYGGAYFDLSEWRWGYVNAVTVTDLDSATGATGCYLIQRRSIPVGAGWSKDKDNMRRILRHYGVEPLAILRARGLKNQRLLIAEAALAYGYSDPADDRHPANDVLAIGADADGDGWLISKRLRANVNLRKYVERHYVR